MYCNISLVPRPSCLSICHLHY